MIEIIKKVMRASGLLGGGLALVGLALGKLATVALHRWRVEFAVARLAASTPRTLTDTEADKLQTLLVPGTEQAIRLAIVALDAYNPSEADLAAVFSLPTLKTLAERAKPECWLLVVQRFRTVVPCVEAFAQCIQEHLTASVADAFVDAGYMGHVYPNADWQKPYKSLLEDDFPPELVRAIADMLGAHLSKYQLNFNMIGTYYVYSFAFEQLTRLSVEGARILARLPVLSPSNLPAPPFWEAYGQHLALSRLTSLSDEAADALSHSLRPLLFGAIDSFPDTPGHVNLAKRLARQKHVVLGRPTLAPGIAEIFSSVTIAPPEEVHDILRCDISTEHGRNRAMFVSLGCGVPNILR